MPRFFTYTSMKGYWGWLAGALALMLRYAASRYPQATESWYSRGLFLWVRKALDVPAAILPFPGAYIFAGLLFILLLGSLFRLWRTRATARERVWIACRSLINFSGWVVFAFFMLWGYNYSRIPVEVQLGLDPVPLSEDMLLRNLERETAELIRLRAVLPDRSIREDDLLPGLEDALRANLQNVLRDNGFPVSGRVRGRLIRPAGIFLRFSTAGLYLPFTGEGHVDPGLAPVQWPYVMAHELAHGYGFGDEGVCNFWAYLACLQSEDVYIQYAGTLGYWRSLAVAYRAYDREAFQAFRATLPPAVLQDLQDISDAMNRFPDLIPRLQYRVYDAYLKSQGIEEGMLNYDRVLVLIHAWKVKKEG